MKSVLHSELLCASALSGVDVPARRWIAPGLIPDRNVTLFSGDGGTGKSLLALQLAVAMSTAGEWIGLHPCSGAALVVSAEDEKDELHRRLDDIRRRAELKFSQLTDLHIWNLAGADAVLARRDQSSGSMVATPLWSQLEEHIRDVKPKVLIIDTLADVFGGDEISRSQTRQFVGMLRGLALVYDLAVLVLAHPSVAGLNRGDGASGSTAWNNSVRSRLYLRHPSKANGSADAAAVESPGDDRVLETVKANYGNRGGKIALRWRNGVFEHENVEVIAQRTAEQQAGVDGKFLELLERVTAEGQRVGPKPSTIYAPTIFASRQDAGGIRKAGFQAAMTRLLANGSIQSVEVGQPSKRRRVLQLVNPANGSGQVNGELFQSKAH